MSAGIDVRAAFAAEEKTIPGAVVGLVPIEESSPAGDRTLPLLAPASVRAIQERANEASEARQVVADAPPPPSSDPRPRTAPIPFVLPPPSDPVLVRPQRAFDTDDGEPVEIPGASAAQRKRMLRIVFGVLGVCALLCVAAVVQQLISGNASGSKTASPIATTAAATADTATATTAATSAASPAVPPPAPTAPVTEPPSPPPIVPPPVVATPVAPAAADPAPPPPHPPAPPPPPRRQAAPAPPRPRQAAPPAAGKPKPAIVRDAPF